MDELQEIDVEQIMEQIRENIRRRRIAVGEGFSPPDERAGINPAPTPSRSPVPSSDGRVAADLASLHSSYDIYHIHLTSHRKTVGPFIVFLKKILQKLLTPILTRQVAYNAANVRVATYLKEQIDGLGQHLARFQEQQQEIQTAHAQELQGLRGELEGRLNAVNARIARIATYLKEQIDGLGQQQALAIQALEGSLAQQQALARQALRERIPGTERTLRRILYLLADGQEVGEGFMPSRQAEGTAAQVELRKVPRQTLKPDFDYFGFEERFRGSEEEIKERQRIYVEYFQGEVLDIGCGRGEFLELLKEAGIQAKGVDVDLDMVLLCREKGLDVVREDAFAYLESLSDEFLCGIFAAQVIEHLEPSRVIQLVNLCHRKLRPGGILILETPNPKCLMVFAESFYMDFSHTRPLHPEAMKFLLESTGFQDVELKFSSPVESSMRIPSRSDAGSLGTTLEEFNRGIDRLNELLYGFQDYAVIGKRLALL